MSFPTPFAELRVCSVPEMCPGEAVFEITTVSLVDKLFLFESNYVTFSAAGSPACDVAGIPDLTIEEGTLNGTRRTQEPD